MATQKTFLVISALGEDHPGLVNQLSRAILDYGCNIVRNLVASQMPKSVITVLKIV